MHKVALVLRWGASRLRSLGISSYFLDAELLLSAASGVSRQALRLEDLSIDSEVLLRFEALIERRAKREPVAYILESKEFWKHRFYINNNVLIPRPDSETLVEAVLHTMPDIDKRFTICDLGVGSGCLIISLLLEYRNAIGYGIDISEAALEVARKNSAIYGLGERLHLLQSDWFAAVPESLYFDIVVSNPPYIPSQDLQQLEVREYEPRIALTDNQDGLGHYKRIASTIGQHSHRSTVLICEIGAHQEQAVVDIMACYGWRLIRQYQDLAGIVRCLIFANL